MLAGDLLRCVPYAWRELDVDPSEIARPSLSADDDDDDDGDEESPL
jgi:hypothetical protein